MCIRDSLVTVIGVVVSFALCGIIAIAGKRGSAPTMILSRAAFGVQGQKVPGVISWLVSIGWETFLAIMAVLATATIFDRLGWGGGTATKVIAAVVAQGIGPAGPVFSHHLRMTPDLFATEAEMRARETLRAAGGPLRLVYSGRLETMKGAQDLLPVARRLIERGVDFTLDIFGTGSLDRKNWKYA